MRTMRNEHGFPRVTPLVIVARDVCNESAELTALGIEYQREERGDQPIWSVRDEVGGLNVVEECLRVLRRGRERRIDTHDDSMTRHAI